MSRLIRKLHGVLHPKPGNKAWFDMLMLAIFGPWLLAGIVSIFSSKPESVEEACSGPGFVDFGCTGGRDAIIANVIGILFILFLLSICIVAALRLINRRQGHEQN